MKSGVAVNKVVFQDLCLFFFSVTVSVFVKELYVKQHFVVTDTCTLKAVFKEIPEYGGNTIVHEISSWFLVNEGDT